MSDADEPSVLATLGIDVDVDYAISDDVWNTLVHTAVDPSTPTSDPSVVPVMDDHGTVPDTGADDVTLTHHDAAHPDHHAVDPSGGDVDDHDRPDEHHHDPGDDDQPDPGTHHTDHDHGSDHGGGPGHFGSGTDWHI